jgi:riboflavin kinase
MTRFRAVFLDVYGTLIDAGDIAGAYQRILARHGHPAGREQVETWLTASREAVRALPDPAGDGWTIDAGRAMARRAAQATAFLKSAGLPNGCVTCAEAIHESWTGTEVFSLYPEVRSVLAQLKQAELVIGAVSNWEPRLPELLRSHGIADFFDFVLSSETAGYAKPSPRLFEMALELGGVRSAEAVHAGDQLIEDVQGAGSAGIAAVLLRRTGEGPAAHSPTIPTLEALLPLVDCAAWLRGSVWAGKGRAAGFIVLDWVVTQVRERLGFVPYAGTLNLRLDSAEARATWAQLQDQPAVTLEPEPGFCAARCYSVSIEGRFQGAIIRPLIPGYPEDALEVIAPVRLREALPLLDGSEVTLAISPRR